MVKHLVLTIYGLFLSAIIGIISALFLIFEGLTSNLIWSNTNCLIRIASVIIGSFILYLLLKKWSMLPKTAHDSIQELKTNQTIDYKDVFPNLLVTIVILSFGAGVGPEAALLSAIISLSIWQADNLRYLYFQYDELKSLSLLENIKRLFNPFSYLQKYDADKAPKRFTKVWQKRILYVVFILNGVVAFGILLRQTDQPSFVMKLGQSHWSLTEMWIFPILLLIGFVFGWIIKNIYRFVKERIEKMNLSLSTKIILGAIGIILISYFAPDLLFSGQHSLHLLIGAWSHKSSEFLFWMAILKLIFLAWCLNLHWRGGDIFPITFAAIIFGFSVAGLLPQFDRLFVVAIIAASVMSELMSPVVTGIFLLFFFPLVLSPIIIVVSLLMFFKNKILTKRA